jgi:hypothetical protein
MLGKALQILLEIVNCLVILFELVEVLQKHNEVRHGSKNVIKKEIRLKSLHPGKKVSLGQPHLCLYSV